MGTTTAGESTRGAGKQGVVHDSYPEPELGALNPQSHRHRSRMEYARELFAPTAVASAFEIAFAQRFYRHVQRGGSPDVDSVSARDRTRRTHWCYVAGAAAATELAVVLVKTSPPDTTELDSAADFVAAWIASAIWLLVPVLIVVRMVRRRSDRQLAQMLDDRATYRAYFDARRHEDPWTAHRLLALGIDL
jgi:hypothetical protein